MIWDAVSDPLLGHWSDKTRSKLGRRHPFMYAALLILPGSFYGLFNPVIDVSGEEAFFYILFLALHNKNRYYFVRSALYCIATRS